jgi:two-component system cell cycle sensor histidine kinase/response regulator CckA
MAALSVAVAFTLVLFAVVGWDMWTMHRASTRIATEEMRLQKLIGATRHLDEVLTMSARMAAATGDARWEERYLRFEPKLAQVIDEAIALAPEVYEGVGAVLTEAANNQLVAMEHRALDLVRRGQREEAWRILESEEYEKLKDFYAAGTEGSAAAMNRRIEAQLVTYRRHVALVVLLALLSLAVLVVAWIGVLALMRRHLTERTRAEEALRQSEARLRAVMTNAPVVLFTLDRSGVFVLSEGAGLEALRRAVGDTIGRSVSDVFREMPDALEYFRRALDGAGVAWTGQFGDVALEWRLVPMRNGGGQPTGVIGLAIDVTARQRAEDDRRALERKLLETQKLESLGVLAGGIAHDFNNLLTGIMGNASLALLDLPTGSPLRERVRQVGTAARRAADLTEQLLAYAGRGRFVVQRLDLNGLVEEMAGLLHASVTKNARLERDLAPGLPAVEGDATQLRQVAMNIVINASEAIGDANGVIRIVTGEVPARHPGAAHRELPPDLPPGRYVYLEVIDTGCGMDDVTLTKIFDPFFTTKFTGRGLGLAAVRGIVRAHRGSVTVASRRGRGTAFAIFLPCAEPCVGRTTDPAPAGIAPGTGETVLLVDDEDDVRTVTAFMLERLGCRVLQATDGREAIETFREHAGAIDTVLLDLTMPRTGGEHAFLEIRHIRPGVRIVLMSGYSEQEVARRFVDRGCAGFLQKPFTVADLEAKLRAPVGDGAPRFALG